ncbi:DNA/RNA nuclease SfsA [Zophobihabitans entericus]|uniref:Sugar fermentation stimulation protein homolog n=1 Tax=Zophobihabitans entericus TaxID=1635327 RepID=A0A6G9IA28_9GAMM|nr:DNA/RNA nuclease SfsA [Zophobihabitans entericus]QIQ21088.1 DNA/RNA nuclease SfsA [Zophobihabitans entericus]
MLFSYPLQSAHLIKRYKRFLADVTTQSNQIITIHCANTGSMSGCAEPGDTVWYWDSGSLTRKYPSSWELTQTKLNHLICINTARANHIVQEAIENDKIPELTDYDSLSSEVRYGDENSRIDLLLQDHNKPACYIEVKSVTLFDEQTKAGMFPDAVTTRGQKHLRELIRIVEQGERAIIFFLIQHSGVEYFTPAKHIDPKYAALLKLAHEQGVEILCYKTHIDTKEIYIEKSIPVEL